MRRSILTLLCAGGVLYATSAGAQTKPDIDAAYRARMDSARTNFTAADASFMSGMIHHHAQAIEMSRMAPTHGASENVQTLAARIINSQVDEIKLMSRWLRDRNQPVPAVPVLGAAASAPASATHDMADMPGMAMTPHADSGMVHMPGMLTSGQMKQLDAARGVEFDRLFLTFMMQHHRGAVSMVHDLFATAGAAQDATVFKFASDVQVDQTTEVRRMERMLLLLSLNGESGH
jgi:uncharacterized protein (DUF305 family)